jgi:hypothetical protein
MAAQTLWRSRHNRSSGKLSVPAAAPRARLALALVLAVFSELRLRGFEQGPVHQGRDRNLDPFLTRTCNALGGTRHGGRITPN